MAEKEIMEVDPVDVKLIASRFAQKLLRFLYLGHIYVCYGVFEDLPGINLYGFPVVYIYAWTIFAALIGVFLFMFGRSTLFDQDVLQMVSSLNWNFVNKVCDGTVYRFFCLWLHWLYPYIVVSACGCYFQVKIPHTRFVMSYYSLLALVEYKDYRFMRWLGQILASTAHLCVAGTVGDLYGVYASLLMVGNMLLVIKGKEEGSHLTIKGFQVPKPLLMAFSSLACSLIVTKSIHMMSSIRSGESVDVPSIHGFTLVEGWTHNIFSGGLNTIFT